MKHIKALLIATATVLVMRTALTVGVKLHQKKRLPEAEPTAAAAEAAPYGVLTSAVQGKD